jgi:hypothetical protein
MDAADAQTAFPGEFQTGGLVQIAKKQQREHSEATARALDRFCLPPLQRRRQPSDGTSECGHV